jgi:hypothetical protein
MAMTTRRFPAWSRVVLILLLPVVAYNGWDYVEGRRLESRLNAIRQRGEPLSLAHVFLRQNASADAAQAARFYMAAGALATDPAGLSIEARNRFWQAWRDGRWLPETLAVARTVVAENREALDLVDRAAPLPFAGFSAGTSYNYRVSDLLRLSHLCEWRAAVAVRDGQTEAALASFASDARLARALDLTPMPVGSELPTFSGLSAVAGSARTSAREALSRALVDIDRDDRLRTTLINSRAFVLSGPSVFSLGLGRAPANPFVARTATRQLDAFAGLIAAADAPWPGRIDAMNAVELWPVGFADRNPSSSVALRNYTRSVAEQVKRIRCARLIVSTTPLTLVDPFTGKPLEVASCRL